MKKAIVFAAAFAAGSAMAQVGSLNGGSISDMGAGARFGAGPQIPPTDMRAAGQPVGALGAGSAGVSAPNSAPQASGSTPIVSGTTWGAAPAGATVGNGQANSVGDQADRPIGKP